jgi:hypothetical protein
VNPTGKRQCSALKKTRNAEGEREQCTNPPVTGATVCRMHGGAARQVKAKGAERIAEEKAQRALGQLTAVLGTAEPVANPLQALAEIAGEALRWKQVIAERVSEMQQIRYTDAKGSEQLRAEIAVFERAMDRCSTILASIVRLNIDERLAAITDRQGHLIAGVIVSVLEQLDLGDQVDRARELVAVELERLEG